MTTIPQRPPGDTKAAIVPLESACAPGPASQSWWNAVRGLLWCEWYAHSKLLLFSLGAWLACVWVLPLYANPAWILLFGGLYALVAGPIYGGSDTIEGCEEFTFSLPPTRVERYLSRLAMGGGTVLLFTALDLLALGLDLPQVLAKLYVDTGLIRPRPVFKSGLLYGLVVALPVAIFALSFVISAVTHSRPVVLTAWFWAALVCLAVLQVGFWYEDFVWDNLNGYFACPLLLVSATAVLWAGHRAYTRKEIGHHSAPITIPPRWWLWIILFIAGLLLALTLASSLAKHYPRLFSGVEQRYKSNSESCRPGGRRNAAVESAGRLPSMPALRQATVNSASICSAKIPSPVIRFPNRAS